MNSGVNVDKSKPRVDKPGIDGTAEGGGMGALGIEGGGGMDGGRTAGRRRRRINMPTKTVSVRGVGRAR